MDSKKANEEECKKLTALCFHDASDKNSERLDKLP